MAMVYQIKNNASFFRKVTGITVFFLLVSLSAFSQLVINEVSQGASGSKEYVELVVTGTITCSGIPAVDLRGWYIDDNNGYHASGSGTGIAPGCIRFTNDPLWAAVPAGTIIVIYNDQDLNASIPAQDLSMTDGNCRLVIPANNCQLLESHATLPSISSAAYPTTGFSSCGVWTTTSMANSDDSYHTVDPAGNVVHAVSWGNNTLNTIIYFSGTSAGMVAWNANAVNANPALQGNWVRTAVAGNETPGAPNNAANAAWIATLSNNCSPFVPLSATGSATGTCNCTGTATAVASGGVAPYSYSWAPSGGNNATATGLCAGSYTCTITDLAGCTQTVIVNVASAAAPAVALQSVSNITCNGGANGSATVNASGGTQPYTYSWAPSGGNNATATGLTVGQYTCTVTDANGCTSTQVVNITQPSALAVAASHTNVACRLGNDGAANVTVTGGNPGYTYSWAPSGGNNATASNLTAGQYTCTITDASGCTTTQTFQVTQPPALFSSITHTNVLCNGGATGSAFVAVLGGAGGYTYAWSPSGGNASTATGLSAGVYTCLITDANGCTLTQTVSITQPTALAVNVTSSPAGCAASNGSAFANVSGGNPGYTYTWTPVGGNAATAINLAAGNYTCTITDANGCTTTAVATVGTTGNSPTAAIIAGGPLTICPNDSVQLTATGASQFLWSTGATTASIMAYTAGTYSVIVTNACGSDTAFITVNTLPPVAGTLTASGPTSFCTGDSVALTASGGNSYTWSTGSTNASITVYSGGVYTVTVTGTCGSVTLSQTVTVSPLPTATITPSGPATFCAGDSVTLVAAGGNSYLWSTGATTASIVVNSAGNYSVTATNSCGSATASQTITVSPLPVAAITASGPLSFCAGDSVLLTATGGGTYLWSTGSTSTAISVNAAGTYIVTVTNSCGSATAQVSTVITPLPSAAISASGPLTFCQGNTVTLNATGGGTYVWSTGATSSSIIVNSAGSFSVTVSNACGSATAFVTTSILPLPVAAVSGDALLCPGESTTLSATGGGTYLWNTGATSSSINTSQPGTYTVIATNACGSDTAVIVVQPSPVHAAFTATPDSGSVPLTVSFTDQSTNGTTWNWNFGSNGSSSAANPQITFNTPGTYIVLLTLTNADGCTDTATALIIVSDVPGVVTMPNVFTPNGDGINDLFVPYTEGIAEFTFYVYDRWGVLMAGSLTAAQGWDGRATSGNEATDGTYYYVVRATAYNGSITELKGFFTLIR